MAREMFPPGGRSGPWLTDEQRLAVFNRANRMAKAESPEVRQARRAAERKAAVRQKLEKARDEFLALAQERAPGEASLSPYWEDLGGEEEPEAPAPPPEAESSLGGVEA